MSKDWKKDIPKKIWLQIGEGQEDEDRTFCEDQTIDTDVEYIRVDQVAKQRTQLLARVREEVVGEEEFVSTVRTSRYESGGFMRADYAKWTNSRNSLRKEQLKKLEIISEEVKND